MVLFVVGFSSCVVFQIQTLNWWRDLEGNIHRVLVMVNEHACTDYKILHDWYTIVVCTYDCMQVKLDIVEFLLK